MMVWRTPDMVEHGSPLRFPTYAEQTMGMPAAQPRRWTRAEVLALIEEQPTFTPRLELIDGELIVTPAPNDYHQAAVTELIVELGLYLRRERVAEVLTSPSDVSVETETVTQPDVYVAPRVRRARGAGPWRELLVAVEVLSPSTARHDRGKKRALYQRNVPEYWIVDIDARLIERWTSGNDRPEILRERLEWTPPGASSPFSLDLEPFFATILAE